MFDVVVEQEISAAHQLKGYQGKCENLHGHNWKVRLEVTVRELDEIGLAIDFVELKAMLKEMLDEYDHKMLNDLPEFSGMNPTSENLARLLYAKCREKIKARKIQIKDVTVWESPRSFIRYYE